jgi:hypothetical protein
MGPGCYVAGGSLLPFSMERSMKNQSSHALCTVSEASRNDLKAKLPNVSRAELEQIPDDKRRLSAKLDRLNCLMSQLPAYERQAREMILFHQLDAIAKVFLLDVADAITPGPDDPANNPDELFHQMDKILELVTSG